jgi:CBS domain-containing protein
MATIRDRVVRDVICLAASSTCDDAARLMTEHGIGSVGVRRAGKLVGLVTERDLVAQLAAGANPAETPLEKAMRSRLPGVTPDATDAECAQLMRSRRTRHLAVQEGGEMIGVISMLDLVDLVVAEKQWSIDQLESYIRGGRAGQLSEPIRTLFHHEPVGGAA